MAEPIIEEADDQVVGEKFAEWMLKRGRLANATPERVAEDAEVFGHAFLLGMVHAASKLAQSGDPAALAALLASVRPPDA